MEVYVPVSQVVLNTGNITLYERDEFELEVTMLPSDAEAADSGYYWSTNNRFVAVVEDNKIIATGAGTARLTFTSMDEKASKTITVTVRNATISMNEVIGPGYYLVGYDIPAGTYDIYGVTGSGHVDTGNYRQYNGTFVNTTLQPGWYVPNVKLANGMFLRVMSDQTVRLVSNNADAAYLRYREQPIYDTYRLAADEYYTAGVDFPAGEYIINLVTGSGNVITDHDFLLNGINEVFGTGTYQITSFQNVFLPYGSRIHVFNSSSNAFIIELSPSY